MVYNSVSSNFVTYIKNGNYEKANEFYFSKIKGNINSEAKAINDVKEYISDIIDKYNNGEITYALTNEKIDIIYDLSISSINFEDDIWKFRELKNSKDFFERGKEYASDGDYENAISQFEKVITEDTNYILAQDNIAEYTNKLQEANTLKINELILQAEVLANENKFQEAISKITEGKAISSTENQRIDEIINKYTELLPVNIADISYLSSSGRSWAKREKLEDFYANSYEKGFCIEGGNSLEEYGSSRVYNNSGGYTSLKGRIIVSKEDTSSDANCSIIFKIYTDGHLVYQREMQQPSKPEDFEINITGIENIKIVVYTGTGGVRWTRLGLVDTYFIK